MKEETVLRKEKYAVMYMYNLYKDAHNRTCTLYVHACVHVKCMYMCQWMVSQD